jgi:TonB family protein
MKRLIFITSLLFVIFTLTAQTNEKVKTLHQLKLQNKHLTEEIKELYDEIEARQLKQRIIENKICMLENLLYQVDRNAEREKELQKLREDYKNNYQSKSERSPIPGRSIISPIQIPQLNSSKQGTIAIDITVDRSGNVTKANYQEKGSTSKDSELIEASKKVALKTKFNADHNARTYQYGTMTYHFEID